MIQEVLDQIIENNKELSIYEASECMKDMIAGNCNDSIIAAFLTALRMKKESIPEITGFAKTMKEHAIPINYEPEEYMLDTAGTGGDTFKTFNVTTIASIIASSGGVLISKHGNRSVSSKCGGADILEALNVNIETNSNQVINSLEQCGFGFIFAPNYHPATKNVMNIRKELNMHTIFNILGPLTCPAKINAQLMGVFDPDLVEPIAEVLTNLGIKKAMVVHGFDNKDNAAMDEISIIGKTKVAFIDNGHIKIKYISPEDFGCSTVNPKFIKAPNTIEEHVQIANNILNNKKETNKDNCRLNLCLMNAGSMLYIANKVDSLEEGYNTAKKLVENKNAKTQLNKIIKFSTAKV